jgi:hypothetical protein
VALLLLKLGLTPGLIGLATIVSRRWGPAVGGLLIALPFTSGPVLLLLAVEHGTTFASDATEGSLAGAAAVAAFCLAYAWAGRGARWWAGFVGGCAGYVAVSLAFQPFITGYDVALMVVAVAAPIVGLALLPARIPPPDETEAPWWDLPARMLLGAALVLGITSFSSVLGPQISGLLATFPVFITVLAVFTHRREGPARAVLLLRGALTGMFATIAFFIVIRLFLVPWGIPAAFTVGIATALAIQAVGLRWIRRTPSFSGSASAAGPARTAR